MQKMAWRLFRNHCHDVDLRGRHNIVKCFLPPILVRPRILILELKILIAATEINAKNL
jgi:hypothetical protein